MPLTRRKKKSKKFKGCGNENDADDAEVASDHCLICLKAKATEFLACCKKTIYCSNCLRKWYLAIANDQANKRCPHCNLDMGTASKNAWDKQTKELGKLLTLLRQTKLENSSFLANDAHHATIGHVEKFIKITQKIIDEIRKMRDESQQIIENFNAESTNYGRDIKYYFDQEVANFNITRNWLEDGIFFLSGNLQEFDHLINEKLDQRSHPSTSTGLSSRFSSLEDNTYSIGMWIDHLLTEPIELKMLWIIEFLSDKNFRVKHNFIKKINKSGFKSKILDELLKYQPRTQEIITAINLLTDDDDDDDEGQAAVMSKRPLTSYSSKRPLTSNKSKRSGPEEIVVSSDNSDSEDVIFIPTPKKKK